MKQKDIFREAIQAGYMQRGTADHLILSSREFYDGAEAVHESIKDRMRRERQERRDI